MKGFIVTHLGRKYKIADTDSDVDLFTTIVRDEFILEGGGKQPFISSFQKLKEGIEFEVELTELDEISKPLSKENDLVEIDPEFLKNQEDVDYELKWKLKEYQSLDALLRKEGLI